jgi:hypothetical protein
VPHGGGSYEIRIKGRLSDSALAAFEGLTATVQPVETVLHGPVQDQSSLHDLLDRIQSLGLELPDHGIRLQVPPLVGLVVDPLVPTKEPQESTTVTPAEIIYHRRVQVLDRAGQTSVTEACRTFGVSRTTYYRWAGRAQRSGLAALLPKAAGHRCCRPPPHPTRSRRCWPRRSPVPPSALGAWSTTWPSVACACRPLACRSSCGVTGSAGGPSGWPRWPS